MEPSLSRHNQNHNNNQNHNHNPNGAISGRQLGEAAHRLVVNSLQHREQHNGHAGQMHHPYPHAVGHRPQYQHYQNHTYPGEHAVMPASSGYSHHGPPSSMAYRQPYVSQAQNQHTRFQNSGNEVYDAPVPYATREYNRHGYYPPQHNGHGYAPHPAGTGVQAPDAYFHSRTGYSNLEADRSYGSNYNNRTGTWVPPVNPNAGRGYNNPRQTGNQFSSSDRGGGRRPPQSNYRR